MTHRLYIILLIIGFFVSCKEPRQNDNLRDVNLLTDSVNILRSKIDTLTQQDNERKDELYYWFSNEDKADLKHRGIADPEKNIIESLSGNLKLIPYPGVLGGTMHFGKISLLGNRWVIADFDDGHIIGRMLLKYTIQIDSSIKWKVIDKYVE